MTMIEEIARAILKVRGYEEMGPLRPYAEGSVIGLAMRDARAAIEAMRSPTDAMLEAAAYCDNHIHIGDDAAKACMREEWQAMIDQALSESKL